MDSFYNNPMTTVVKIDYNGYYNLQNCYTKFIETFNEINFSKCSNELKEAYKKKLNDIKSIYLKYQQVCQSRIEYYKFKQQAMYDLKKGIDDYISTDIESIKNKIVGFKRLSSYFIDLISLEAKKEALCTKWIDMLNNKIQGISIL